MRLYQAKVLNTCPRRVTIYMAEKGIECDIVTVDMRAGVGRTPEFLRKNPNGTVPVLELDDGSYLPDSSAIIEYLEELFPDPPMLGMTSAERAQIRATERMATEFQTRNGLWSVNSHPSWPQRRPDFVQYPDVATFLAPGRDRSLEALEARIGESEFLCGSRPTVADCGLFAAVDTINRLTDYEIPETVPRLRAWFERFRKRPSAQYPDWAVRRADA
jgi:glutathione S-transferase